MMLVAGCLALLTGCEQPISVIQELTSPDREHKAVVFTSHGGGVASDLHTSVSILPLHRAQPNWPPNTFTALHRDEGSPQGPFFGPSIRVRWLSARTLEITYDPRASVLRQYEEVRGVQVVYRAAPQDHRPSRGLPLDSGTGPGVRTTTSRLYE